MAKKKNEITPYNCGFWMYIKVMQQSNVMQQNDIDQMFLYIEQFAFLNNINITRLIEFIYEIKILNDESFFSRTDKFMQENNIADDKLPIGEESLAENDENLLTNLILNEHLKKAADYNEKILESIDNTKGVTASTVNDSELPNADQMYRKVLWTLDVIKSAVNNNNNLAKAPKAEPEIISNGESVRNINDNVLMGDLNPDSETSTD